MRENVKKLIDLMASESWQLFGAWFVKRLGEYPRIDFHGYFISPRENLTLELTEDETVYFHSVRTSIYKEWKERDQKLAEEELNKFFK